MGVFRKFGLMTWVFLTLFCQDIVGREETEIVYDDFSDEGISYLEKWTLPYYGIAGETFVSDGGALALSFLHKRLKVSAPEFQWSSDYLYFDHIKYLALSTQEFPLPDEGSVMFSSQMKAYVFNTYPTLLLGAYRVTDDLFLRYKVNEGRQASAILRMSNAHQTGQVFDWVVYGNRAFALTERLFGAPLHFADIDTAYSQIIKIFDLTPGLHNFAIRYNRSLRAQRDNVEYLIDGKVMVTVKNIGIPLDQQKGIKNKDKVADPSQGKGERIIDKMTTMVIGHGLFSRLDVFPYQQRDLSNQSVMIPLRGSISEKEKTYPRANSRLWGQGAIGFYYNFVVNTTSYPGAVTPETN